MSDDREGQDQRIRERAYALWEQEGRQHGSPDDHWYRARREIEQADEKSGSAEDQTPGAAPDLDDPAGPAATLPAAPEDEPAPALSATLEEAPGEPALAKPSPRVKAAKPAGAAAAKPAAKPRKKPTA